jgi:hypothetical protein
MHTTIKSTTMTLWTTRTTHPDRARWLAVAAALIALAALAGCSSSTPPPATMPPAAPQLRAALEHWSAFPADDATRPLVVEADSEVTGPAGFASGADKHAFYNGAIDLPRSLPSGPGQAAGYPLISAAAAAAQLMPNQRPAPATRLAVTGVKLGTGLFVTDRGQKALPAWQFSLTGVTGTVDVLAVADSARYWPAGLRQLPMGVSAVQPGRSGRVLRLITVGAREGTGACEATYSVRQQSSAHAVAVYVVERDHGGATVCASAGFLVRVPVTLAAPLGNRVLVNAQTFAPIPVTQSLVSSS